MMREDAVTVQKMYGPQWDWNDKLQIFVQIIYRNKVRLVRKCT